MDRTFADFFWELWLEIYMDDSNVHTSKGVMDQQCRETHLFLKVSKCNFEKEELNFVSSIISKNFVKMDPLKTKAIAHWPTLQKKKDLQSFLGFANYYQHFIKNFAELALPLNGLTGDVPWEWTADCQKAYEDVKAQFLTNEILAMPNFEDKHKIKCDASYYATGSVLSQFQDRIWKPITFASWTMSPAQRNYQVYNKELLTVIPILSRTLVN